MKHLKSIPIDSKGFTLVEIIVTLVAAGILGAIFVQFMGTALDASWNSVEIVRDEAGSEAVLERIMADYVVAINSDPDNALGTLVTKKGNGDYGTNVTMQYIDFDIAGSEFDTGGVPSNNLKVVIQPTGQVAPAITGRFSMTAILTKSRTANDPFILY